MPHAHTMKPNGKRKCEDPFAHKPKNPRRGKRGSQKKQKALSKVKAILGKMSVSKAPSSKEMKAASALLGLGQSTADKSKMDAAHALLGLGG